MKRLSEHLYCLEDTCRVYVVRSGPEAVLVDFGSGAVLDELPALGVERALAVLMTHHHRDQGQGLARAVERGIPIFVPHAEQDLFHSVDAHWQAREILNSYNNRQDRFSPLEPVPIAGTLKDYATYCFGDLTLSVVPTPGHTTGSVTLLAEIDGARVAFSGDLIAAPGKVWSLAATQWSYNGAEGVAASIASLLELKDRRPDLLLPSHGEAMLEPAAIDALVKNLWALLRHRRENPRLFQLRGEPFVALSPHLLWNRTSEAYGYVLLSNSRKALFIDFGYDFTTRLAAGSDRASRRPWLYTLPVLKRDFGVENIDVALPTHYHDDHVAGLNLLREVEGTRIWAAETFADILEQPSRYDLPCLWYDPVPVDRVLPLETPLQWEEYSLTLYPQPGHTTYAVAVSTEVDGLRVLFNGDQYQGGAAGWNYVYNNGFHAADYKKSAALYRRLQPDLVLSGHWEPYRVEPGYFDRLIERGESLHHLHHALLPLERVNGENLVTLRPYTLELAVGEEGTLIVTVRNPFAQAETVAVSLVVPQGWQAEPEVASVKLEANAEGCLRFTLLPAAEPVRRARVAAEVTVGGARLGQLAEALVTVTKGA